MKKQLVIGLGTGRSGTVSFVDFFDHQPDCLMLMEGSTHDSRVILNWDGDDDRAIEWLEQLERISGSASHYGDTGFYYLPYVNSILARFPDARFVCLERQKELVVASYLRKTSDNRHFWYDHAGDGFRADPVWDRAFPKFAEQDKTMALGLYWDMYHQRSTELEKLHPTNFKIFHVDDLNTIDGRNRILDFVEYNGERSIEGNFRDD